MATSRYHRFSREAVGVHVPHVPGRQQAPERWGAEGDASSPVLRLTRLKRNRALSVQFQLQTLWNKMSEREARAMRTPTAGSKSHPTEVHEGGERQDTDEECADL